MITKKSSGPLQLASLLFLNVNPTPPSSLDKLQVSISFPAHLLDSSWWHSFQKICIIPGCVPRTEPRALTPCSQLIIECHALRGCDSLHFAQEAAEAQKNQVTCPRSLGQPRHIFAPAGPAWEPFPVSAIPPGLRRLSFGGWWYHTFHRPESSSSSSQGLSPVTSSSPLTRLGWDSLSV